MFLYRIIFCAKIYFQLPDRWNIEQKNSFDTFFYAREFFIAATLCDSLSHFYHSYFSLIFFVVASYKYLNCIFCATMIINKRVNIFIFNLRDYLTESYDSAAVFLFPSFSTVCASYLSFCMPKQISPKFALHMLWLRNSRKLIWFLYADAKVNWRPLTSVEALLGILIAMVGAIELAVARISHVNAFPGVTLILVLGALSLTHWNENKSEIQLAT